MAGDIFTVIEPNIILDDLWIHDVEYGTDPDYKPDGKEVRYSKLVGDMSPFISINNMRFQGEDIKHFELNLTQFLPTVTVILYEKGGLFASKSFPRDGDRLSIYIKSNNRDFKSIRQDYRINYVSAPVSLDETGELNTYTIEAFLNLPNMMVDVVRSFPQMTSFEALKVLCKEVGLGLATNETSYNDKMTWICPSIPYTEFLKNDLFLHAYKDDDSFFRFFIDQYYYLNVVEVNSTVKLGGDLDKSTIDFLSMSNYMPDDPQETPTFTGDFYFTNSKKMYNTPNHITGYSPQNNSGINFLRNGYRNYVQYYDKDEKDFKQFFVEALNSEGAEEKIVLKGRFDEDHTVLARTRYSNSQSVNVHPNYKFAKTLNQINNDELRKLGLLVDLAGVNISIYRSQRVPVYIINDQSNEIRKQATDEREGDTHITDMFLSGWYIIDGMKLIFSRSRNRFHSKVMLTRREYDLPT